MQKKPLADELPEGHRDARERQAGVPHSRAGSIDTVVSKLQPPCIAYTVAASLLIGACGFNKKTFGDELSKGHGDARERRAGVPRSRAARIVDPNSAASSRSSTSLRPPCELLLAFVDALARLSHPKPAIEDM